MADGAVTAVIIDDHEVVRDGVRSWCAGATPPIRLVGASARPAVAFTGPGASADVVILDLQLSPAGYEFETLKSLVAAGRRVVVYTQHAQDAAAVQCIRIGALAYVTKSEGKDHLVAAVHGAARGKPYTPPSLGGAILTDDDPDRPHLAPMEVAALRTWFASSSKRLAARSLGISPKTVDTYIERARVKYAAVGRPAPSKSALVARALEDGLIELTDLRSESR